MDNIYPIFEKMLCQADKERLLRQRALVLWFTGLSGSGKSTLAIEVEKHLHYAGFLTMLLDGDNIRSGLSSDLGFTEKARLENARRSAEAAKLFLQCGIITLCSFISPTQQIRRMIADIIGKDHFHHIYVNTPLEDCMKRDVKGIYAKARRGEIKHLPGWDVPFELPVEADLEIETRRQGVIESVEQVVNYIRPYIIY